MGRLTPEEAAERHAPVKENIKVQQVHWRIERVGFVALIVLITLALLGVFSSGPLSQVQQQTESGNLAVEYQRFIRNGATSELIFTLHSRPGQTVEMTLDDALLEEGTVEGMVPEPVSSFAHKGAGLVLRLQANAEGLATVRLAMRSSGIGSYRYSVHANGESLPLHQFIYP